MVHGDKHRGTCTRRKRGPRVTSYTRGWEQHTKWCCGERPRFEHVALRPSPRGTIGVRQGLHGQMRFGMWAMDPENDNVGGVRGGKHRLVRPRAKRKKFRTDLGAIDRTEERR